MVIWMNKPQVQKEVNEKMETHENNRKKEVQFLEHLIMSYNNILLYTLIVNILEKKLSIKRGRDQPRGRYLDDVTGTERMKN